MPRYSAPRIVRLSSVRGLGTSPDVLIALDDVPRELTVEPDVVVLTCEDGSIELECAGGAAPQTPQYEEYEMELVNRRSSTLAWRSTRQVPASGALLSFVVADPAALGAGDYDMIVRGHSPGPRGSRRALLAAGRILVRAYSGAARHVGKRRRSDGVHQLARIPNSGIA